VNKKRATEEALFPERRNARRNGYVPQIRTEKNAFSHLRESGTGLERKRDKKLTLSETSFHDGFYACGDHDTWKGSITESVRLYTREPGTSIKGNESKGGTS
jgi:hypothetical protein